MRARVNGHFLWQGKPITKSVHSQPRSCLDMNFIEINDRIEVITRFKVQGDPASLVVPAKMRWRKQEIVFTELGLRHPTSKGQRMIHVFDMSDGVNDYRLEFDAEMLTWTLKTIIESEA